VSIDFLDAGGSADAEAPLKWAETTRVPRHLAAVLGGEQAHA
jgi:hypothetical protein